MKGGRSYISQEIDIFLKKVKPPGTNLDSKTASRFGTWKWNNVPYFPFGPMFHFPISTSPNMKFPNGKYAFRNHDTPLLRTGSLLSKYCYNDNPTTHHCLINYRTCINHYSQILKLSLVPYMRLPIM